MMAMSIGIPRRSLRGIKNIGIIKNLDDLPNQLWSKLKANDSLVIMTNKDSVKIRNILDQRSTKLSKVQMSDLSIPIFALASHSISRFKASSKNF